MAGYRIFLNRQKLKSVLVSLPHCLTTVTAKRSSTWSPFYTTIKNSPAGCAFWCSKECRPSAPGLLLSSIRLLVFFFIQKNHIEALIFHINTFFQQHIYLPQNYFRAGFQKRFSPGATVRGTLARYLQLHDWIPSAIGS